MSSPRTAHRKITPFGVVLLALGVLYLALSLSGFADISDDTNSGGGLYGGNQGDQVWGLFGASTVSNFLHALAGVLLLFTARSLTTSPMIGWMTAVALGLLTLYGIVALAVVDFGDPLNLNLATVLLYLVSLVLVAVATWQSGRYTPQERGGPSRPRPEAQPQ